METTSPKPMRPSLTTRLIAPCGLNCGLCLAHLREKNHCPGCRDMEKKVPPYMRKCVLRTCARRKGDSCRACPDPWCRRMKQLDKRYRESYGVSPIANLEAVREYGVRRFVEREKSEWQCPRCGALLCMHRAVCLACGVKRGKAV